MVCVFPNFESKVVVLALALAVAACGGGSGGSGYSPGQATTKTPGIVADPGDAPTSPAVNCSGSTDGLDVAASSGSEVAPLDAPATSRTWWVVAGSPPDGDGTEELPWDSIGDVNTNKAEIFDDPSEERIVYIVGEFRSDPLILDGANSATATRPIQIRGDAPDREPGVLDGTGNGGLYGIWLARDDYVDIAALEVRNWLGLPATDCIRVEVCRGIKVSNVHVHHCGFDGIVARDVDDYTVQDSIAHDNAKGIVVGSRDYGQSPMNNNILLKGNICYANRIYGMQAGGDSNAPVRFDINAKIMQNTLYGNGAGLQIENAGSVEVMANEIYTNNYRDIPKAGNQYNSGMVIQSVHDVSIHENNTYQHDLSSILWTKDHKDNYNIWIYRNSLDDATEAHFSSLPYGTNGAEGNFLIFSNRLMHSAGVGNDFNIWNTDILSTVANNTGSGGINGVNAKHDGAIAFWSFVNNIWSSYSKTIESASTGALNILTNCYHQSDDSTLITHNGLDYNATEILAIDPGAVIENPVLGDDLNISSLSSPCLSAGTAVTGVTVDINGNDYLIPPSIGMTAYESVPVNPEANNPQCSE